MVIESEGIARKRALEGYTYQDERGFDVAERVASNEAVGAMTNTGVGLGMMAGVGMGVGGAVGGAVGGMVQNTMGNAFSGTSQAQAQPPPQDIAPSPVTDGISDFEQRIQKLELLKGKIPDELYETKMQEILNSI
jgi:hypothetical protein